MNQYQLVIATDLDGTFLEGDEQTKKTFYKKISNLREHVLLIYTTGRSVAVVKSFCDRGYLPMPHFVLGDHGTHIVEGINFSEVEELQSSIVKTWNNGNQLLKDLLGDKRGIRLQPINPPYRVAYYYDPYRLENQTLEKINNAGFDFILSCDSYLDILPRGVNKGSSLLRLIDYLHIEHESVITSGDSLNDLPLFETGLKSTAVANSEPKLVEIIQQFKNVYHSKFPGLLGVMDGLQFYGKFHLFEEQAPYLFQI